MNRLRVMLWAIWVLVASSVPAAAQDPDRSAPFARREHPITIGVSGTGVLTWIASGVDLRVTLSVPVRERVALEFFGGPFHGTSTDADFGFDDIRHFYGFQVKREIDRGRRPGVTPFLTFGGAGVIARETTYNCQFNNCVPRQKTQVVPPLLGLFGGGVEVVVSPHLAIRAEAQGIVAVFVPAGLRASFGISIPIGHRYGSAAR